MCKYVFDALGELTTTAGSSVGYEYERQVVVMTGPGT